MCSGVVGCGVQVLRVVALSRLNNTRAMIMGLSGGLSRGRRIVMITNRNSKGV